MLKGIVMHFLDTTQEIGQLAALDTDSEADPVFQKSIKRCFNSMLLL